MGRHLSVEITPELIEKVLRCYTEKHMSIDVIGKLVCPRFIADKIIKQSGIPIKTRGQGMRDDQRFEYRAPFSSHAKKKG